MAIANPRDYWPTLEWRTAKPESAGMRPDMLLALDQTLNTQYRSIQGIFIARNGLNVFERYAHGSGPDEPHPVASVTKSFISALVGMAIDAGYIRSVDQKVLDFFPEYVSSAGDIQKRSASLKHLLTMTAPFAWKTGPRGNEPLDRLRRQRDWITFLLDLLGQNGQLGQFQYSSASSHLLSAILTRATGLSAREFANEHLFGHLGMRKIPDQAMQSYSQDDVFGKNATGWVKDPHGNSAGGWGLCITPRDMARFGFLYLNRGVWDGKQIVSGAWVTESTAPNANGYGYQWWVKDGVYAASGFGGSHIFCVPQKDLVVAIVSTMTGRSRDRWLLLNQCILPALID